jgi:hypothetical protein
MVGTDGKVDLDSEALPIRLEMLLPMPMKEGLKTTADETGSMPMKRRSMKNSIVIETDREIDRC